MKNLKWSLLFVFSSLFILSSCGNENRSGQSGNTSYFDGVYSGIPPMVNPGINPAVQSLFSLPCSAGGIPGPQQRMGSGSNYNVTLPPNSIYAGMTVEGDIALLTSDGVGRSVISLYICPRPNVIGGNLVSPRGGPAIAYGVSGCLVDQITAMNVQLGSNFGALPLLTFFAPKFHPVQQIQLQIRQQLRCSY